MLQNYWAALSGLFNTSEEVQEIEGCNHVNRPIEGLRQGIWRTRCVGYLVVTVFPLQVEFFGIGDCVEVGGSCLD